MERPEKAGAGSRIPAPNTVDDHGDGVAGTSAPKMSMVRNHAFTDGSLWIEELQLAVGHRGDIDNNGIEDVLDHMVAEVPSDMELPVIVLFANSEAFETSVVPLERAGAKLLKRFESVAAFSVSLPAGAIQEVATIPGVARVYHDAILRASLASSAPSIAGPQARAMYAVNGSGVGIAILDTGIDSSHCSVDDFDDNRTTADPKISAFFDAVNGRHLTAYDDHGHGTHVAGIAAGTGCGGPNIGMAPGARLIGIKVLDSAGMGTESWIIGGIDWAIGNRTVMGIHVLSASLGANVNGDGTSPMELAATRASEAGIVTVFAAGNNGPNAHTVGIPGSARDIITVGAVDNSANVASFSSRGPTADGRLKPEISAPGVGVSSADAGTTTGFVRMSGTSMATPHVAGLIALMIQRANLSFQPSSVLATLQATSVDRGIVGADNNYGAGVVESLGAVGGYRLVSDDLAVQTISVTPTSGLFLPSSPAVVSVQVRNLGSRNQSGVVVSTRVNSTVVNESTPRDLTAGASTLVNFTWVLPETGSPLILAAEVLAVPGETDTSNNFRNTTILLGCEMGLDGAGYTCGIAAFEWRNLTAGTTVALGDDSVSSAITLPFLFPWYGLSNPYVYIGSNGLVCFVPTSCAGYNPTPIPSSSAPNDLIACFWEDLDPGSAGTVRYATVGTAPSRVFVVEFSGVPHFFRGGSNSFQIHLAEDGTATCMYSTVASDMDGIATAAGSENGNGVVGLRLAYREFSATSVGVSFVPPAPSAPDAPSLRALSGPRAGQITIAWDQPTRTGGRPIENYTIYMGNASGNTNLMATVAGTASSHTVTGVAQGQSRFFRVAAVNSAGEGILSGETNSTPPTTPTACEFAGRDAGGYECRLAVVQPANMSGATSLIMGDDEVSLPIDLGFNISWYGRTRWNVSIGSNGLVCFTPTGCWIWYPSTPPSSSVPNDFAACYWEDLDPRYGGNISYVRVGSQPNRKFVVEYRDIPHYMSNFTNTFQIQIGEDGEVRCILIDVSTDSDGRLVAAATENLNGTVGVRLAFSEFAAEGLGFSFTPSVTPALPSPPSSPIAYAGPQADQITLFWRASDDGGAPVTAFRVYGGNSSGTLALIGQAPGTAYSFVDTGFLTRTTRYYRVTALNGVGEGLRSVEASATSLGPPPFCEIVGPDASGYACALVPFDWKIISGGTRVSLGDDDTSAPIQLPFNFNWYGTPRSRVIISSNGLLCLGSASGCASFTPPAPPSPATPNDYVACLWEDLHPGVAGVIQYETIGSEPNRVFVAEYDGVPHYYNGPRVTFQIQLWEQGDAKCMLKNAPTDGDGARTAVGTENDSGLAGLRYTYSEFAATNMGVRFASQTSSQIPVFTATLNVTTGLFSDSATIGAQANATDGFDAFWDRPEPPMPPGEHVQLYLSNSPAQEADLRRLDQNVKGTTSPLNWTLVLHYMSSPNRVNVTWTSGNFDELPSGMSVTLVTPEGRVDMRTQGVASFDIGAEGDHNLSIIIASTTTMVVPVHRGWNLFSLPVEVEDGSPTALFGAGQAVAYRWNAAGRRYEQASRLEPGAAYWVFAYNGINVSVVGQPVSLLTSNLGRGWNLMGATSASIEVAAISTVPPNCLLTSSVYAWENPQRTYRSTTTIDAGRGYWVYALQDCSALQRR
ncbi:MAG: S8 family serine peptidase [Euryarchaeota archaeon]|nr:S8 family serine peptidase [Euryarchaeota archaeon]